MNRKIDSHLNILRLLTDIQFYNNKSWDSY